MHSEHGGEGVGGGGVGDYSSSKNEGVVCRWTDRQCSTAADPIQGDTVTRQIVRHKSPPAFKIGCLFFMRIAQGMTSPFPNTKFWQQASFTLSRRGSGPPLHKHSVRETPRSSCPPQTVTAVGALLSERRRCGATTSCKLSGKGFTDVCDFCHYHTFFLPFPLEGLFCGNGKNTRAFRESSGHLVR